MVDFNGSFNQCQQFAAAVSHPLYRTMQMVHVVCSAISIFLLVNVLVIVKKRLPFHFNIKILFVSLLCACMFHSVWILTFTVHHLIVSFTYGHRPCDVILKRNIYQFFNIPQCTAVLWIEFTTILMFVERCIATLFYRCYELSGKKLGKILLVLTMVIPMILTFIIFYGKPVDEPQISSLYSPASAAPIVTLYFVALSSLNFVSAIASVGLYYYNKKKEHIMNESLTAKYQTAENAVSSKFIAVVISGTLLLFGIYGTAVAFLKITMDTTKLIDVYYKIHIMMAYDVPIYTCLLPFIIREGIKQIEKRRHTKVDNLIQVQAIGEEGWNNYAEQLRQQWGQ